MGHLVAWLNVSEECLYVAYGTVLVLLQNVWDFFSPLEAGTYKRIIGH